MLNRSSRSDRSDRCGRPSVSRRRRITASAAIAVAFALCSPLDGRAQSAPVRSDQEILIQLEHDWDAAFHRHDAAFIDRILADEFIVTYDNGARADRKVELELATSLNENIESSTLDEFIVKEFGNTAIVWFTLHLVGPIKGERVQNDYRYTDVFVLRDGRWQCVSSQSTHVDRTLRVGP